jgi:hypothetical protein
VEDVGHVIQLRTECFSWAGIEIVPEGGSLDLCGRRDSCPIWKGIPAGLAEGSDQIANDATPFVNRFNQLFQSVMVIAVPFWRNVLRTTPDVNDVSLFRFAERWFKRLPTCYVLIDTVPGIDSPQRRIWKRPLSGIKAVPLGAT